ncbi:MAG: Ig-like domain-containing protein [Pseudoclavibacter sp.]
MSKRDGRRWRWWQWALSIVLAVAIAVPLIAAFVHRGYAGADIGAGDTDIWVVNQTEQLAGRVDTQVHELTGSIGASSTDFDVLQDGDDVFVHDGALGTLSRLDTATGLPVETVSVPVGSDVEIRAGMLAVLERASGRIWVAGTQHPLTFDANTMQPVLQLGPSAQVTVTVQGEVVAAAVGDQSLYRVAGVRTLPQRVPMQLALGSFQLTAVGNRVVIFDIDAQMLYFDDGRTVALSENAMHLQEVSEENDYVALATPSAIKLVPFRDGVRDDSIGSGGAQDVSLDPRSVSRPIVYRGCHYGAFGALAVVVGGCPGQADFEAELVDPLEGGTLEFRAGASELALNNTRTGDVYLPLVNMKAIDNWDEVRPPDRVPADDLAEPDIETPLSDTLDARTETNRAPEPEDDLAGVRPGSAIVIPVLRITSVEPAGDPVGGASGAVDLVDEGRAIRFTPADGASGSLAYRYQVSDGRPGGVAEAIVRIRIIDDGSNSPPEQVRPASLSIEEGMTGDIDVLDGWFDAEGDPVHLTSATGGDGLDVRFTPDGIVTVTGSGEARTETVDLVVSDGTEQRAGALEVVIAEPGSLAPSTTADFATGSTDAPITIDVTANDIGVGGEPPTLVDAVEAQGRPGVSFDDETGTVALDAPLAGIYSVIYTVQVGERTARGIARIDVADANALGDIAPVAVDDAVFLQGMEPGTVDLLANDTGDSSRVLAVIGLGDTSAAQAAGLRVELIDHAILRVTPTLPLTEPVAMKYTLSDGAATDTATVVVTPGPAIEFPRPPETQADEVTVRAGDAAVVAPLVNDTHPDRLDMHLDPELDGLGANGGDPDGDGSADGGGDDSGEDPADGGDAAEGESPFGDGVADVDGDTVRLRAPSEPGTYTIGYTAVDALGGVAPGEIIVTVTEIDSASNEAPKPERVDVRAAAGTPVRVDLPLAGIDPDGDFVTISEVPDAGELGTITEVDATSLTFTPRADARGTETIPVVVGDAFGATATLELRIGVVAPPASPPPPVAVDDIVTVPPGSIFSVRPLDNDTDPSGLGLSLADEVPPNDVGASVTIDDDALVIDPPAEATDFSISYRVVNAAGQESTAEVHVSVRHAADLPAPTATTLVVTADELRETTVVDVPVLDGATNPTGSVGELRVDLVDAGAPATVDGGVVRVQGTSERQVIAYRVTSPVTGESAVGLIVVPPIPRS